MQTVFPNVYQTMWNSGKKVNITKKASIENLFPSSKLGLQAITQIAYYTKKQSQLAEIELEKRRNESYESLLQVESMYGKATKLFDKSVKYKVVMPNLLGLPSIMYSGDIKSLNYPISIALNVPNFTIKAPNAMAEIQANQLKTGKNVIQRKNSEGFVVKIFILKYN